MSWKCRRDPDASEDVRGGVPLDPGEIERACKLACRPPALVGNHQPLAVGGMLRKLAKEIGCVISSICRTGGPELVSSIVRKERGKRAPSIKPIVPT